MRSTVALFDILHRNFLCYSESIEHMNYITQRKENIIFLYNSNILNFKVGSILMERTHRQSHNLLHEQVHVRRITSIDLTKQSSIFKPKVY